MNKKYILAIRIIILIIPFLISCSQSKRDIPIVKKGVFHTESWNFSKDGNLRINGTWAFQWMNFVKLKDQKLKNNDFISVPGEWQEFHITNKSHNGYGTYSCKIHFADKYIGKTMAIKYKSIFSAIELFIDGKLLSKSGSISKSPLKEIANRRPGIARFKPMKNSISLTLHISNFDNSSGGIPSPIFLGTESNIEEQTTMNLLIDLFILGSILIMALYHLGLFSIRKSDLSSLYFGIFCLIISLRGMLMGEMFFYKLFPGSTESLRTSLEYLTFYTAIPVMILFIRSLYPEEFHKHVQNFALLFSGFFIASVIILPTNIFTGFLKVYQAFTLISGIYALIAIILAIYHKRHGAVVFFLGFLVLFSSTINDILHANLIIISFFMVPLGLFIFIFLQSYLLSQRFSIAFKSVKNLSKELKDKSEKLEEMNLHLEDKVAKRTEELLSAMEEMESMNDSLIGTNKNLIKTQKKVEERTQEVEHREEELRKHLDRFRQDLQLAKTIQQKVMPGDTWTLERIMIDIRYMPLIEIGGDIFDVLNRDDGSIRVFLADATGHGIVAALITMLIKSEYEKVKEKVEDPFKVLSKLNDAFMTTYLSLNIFFTAIILDIYPEEGYICYASAGHPEQYILRDGEIVLMTKTNRAVGLLDDFKGQTKKIDIIPDDIILLFTDGLTEEFDSDNIEFGEKRLKNYLKEQKHEDLQEIIDNLFIYVSQFLSTSQLNDDITVIGIDYK